MPPLHPPRLSPLCSALCSVVSLAATALGGVGLPASAWANDTTVGDANGSIVFVQQADVRMDSETLSISEDRVEVEYTFTNTSAHDVQARMSFPMPPLKFDELLHSVISDFQLWVNGVPQPTEHRQRILLDGRQDITAEFQRRGLSLQDLDNGSAPSDDPSKGPNLPDAWYDVNGILRVTVQENDLWTQRFPAGHTVRIRHRYVPSLSSSVPQPLAFFDTEFQKSVCLDAQGMADLRQRERPGGIPWATLEYILTTANNWQGPIGQFHLIIEKKTPSDLMSLCFPGALQQTSDRRFEFTAKDFRPEHDLRILFVSGKD
jgi:hypothetical protein